MVSLCWLQSWYFAIVDTNTDPDTVDYPIPANDDSIRAIKLIVGEISRSICESRSIAYPTGATLESDSSEDKSPEDDSSEDKSPEDDSSEDK